MELVGHEPSLSAYAVYAEGDYAYVCSNDALVILYCRYRSETFWGWESEIQNSVVVLYYTPYISVRNLGVQLEYGASG